MAELTLEQKRAIALANARKRMAQEEAVQSDLISPAEEAGVDRDLFDTGETLLRQGLQGATFGFADEIYDPIAAGIASAVTGEPYDVMLSQAREMTPQELSEDWDQAPVLSAVSNIGGGLLTGAGAISAGKALAPKATGALINVAKEAPKTTTFLTGAGSTGLYSAGEAQGPALERLDDFGTGAALGGPLGYGGYKLVKGIGATGNALVEKYGPAIAPYIQRAQEAVSPVFRRGGGRTISTNTKTPFSADKPSPQDFNASFFYDDASDYIPIDDYGSLKYDYTIPSKVENKLLDLSDDKNRNMLFANILDDLGETDLAKEARDGALDPDIAAEMFGEENFDDVVRNMGFLGVKNDVQSGQFRLLPEAVDQLKFKTMTDQAADDLISPAGQQADDISLTQMAGILDEEDLARLEQGRTIPLTKGDRTQDVAIQRAEQIAAEAGSEPILQARATQQAAARKPFINALGEEAETAADIDLRYMEQSQAEDVAGMVRGRFDELKAAENAAWSAAREAGEAVSIEGAGLKRNLVQNIDNFLSEEAYRTGDIPGLDKKVNELRELVQDQKIETIVRGPYSSTTRTETITKPVDIKKLDNWKKRLNAQIGNTPIDQKDTLRKLKMIGRQYDDYMTELADDAIIGGDISAIEAFKAARASSRERFALEESDTVIKNIIENRDLQGEQLVNVMMNAEKLTAKGDSGRALITMLQQAGDKAPEMRDAMKKGIMAKTFRRGLQKNSADPSNPDLSSVSFAKMRNELENLMQKKEIFETIFDPTEQQYMRQFYDDLKFLASKQKGAINNSSTGVWTAEFAKGFGKLFNNPLVRSNPVSGILGNMGQEQAERYAAQQITGKAEQGLAEFVEKQINQVDAPAAYYGALGASAVGPEGIADLLGFEFEGEE